MTKVQSPKPLISRRFLAFLLTISFLVSALPSLWFARLVMADGALAEDGHNVYHDEEEFDLFHTVGEERWRKKIQYLYAETIEGSMLPVYCVMAGAPSPENGSITPSVMQDPAARELLGKIQYIIDMDSSMFQVGDTVDGHPHMHYYVKQLLIWHLIYLYQDGLASDSQQYFKGIDVRSFLDVDENGPTAMVIINEANRLWDVYDAAGRPALEGAYTPHYKASVKNASEPVWNESNARYLTTFTVTVQEAVKGNKGGTFRFTGLSGGQVYLKGADGKYSKKVTLGDEYPSGSAFAMVGSWNSMIKNGSKRTMGISVEASDNGENTRSQLMYGYFFDQSPSESGKARQTYVGWHVSSAKTFGGDEYSWSVKTTPVDLEKQAVYASIAASESGAEFQVFRAEYGSFEKAKAEGLGFLCVSNEKGKIVDKSTGEALVLPSGKYTVYQTVVPAGTKAMSPNPASITVDTGKSNNKAVFKDEIRSGCFAIEKKIQTGYDTYAGKAFAELSPEKGAKFQVWNTKYASYDKAPAEYRDLLTTDGNGYARSKILPYGDYKVHQIESEATKYTYACEDTVVKIRGEKGQDEPEQVLQLVDKQYELKIQIRKVNAKTGEIIPAAGVEFQVLDESGKILKDWDGKDTFVTGSDGTVSLQKLGLKPGTYYVKETKAPAGFVLSEDPVKIEAKKDESFIGVGPKGDMKAVPLADEEVSVELELIKSGEQLTSVRKTDAGWEELEGHDFTYSSFALSGATFELYCMEDVKDFYRDISLLEPSKYPEGAYALSSDGGSFAPYKTFDTDGDGTAETPLKKGTYLGTYTTGEDGRIRVSGLSLDSQTGKASYKMVEVSAPKGFLTADEPVVFEVSDDRQSQKEMVVKKTAKVENARQKAELSFTKVGRNYVFDPESGRYVPVDEPLPEAVFGIFTAEPIYSCKGELLLEENTLIEVVTANEDGLCRTSAAYPLGYSFYAREISVPYGYVGCDEKLTIYTEGKEGDHTTKTFAFGSKDPVVNEISRSLLVVEKLAADTSLPMKGVEFEVLTKDGFLIETIVTDEDGKAETKTAFPIGETLILHETKTNQFYALAGDTEVKIIKCQKDASEYEVQEEKIFNYRLSEIRVEKVCGDGTETPMDGVIFQLWKTGETEGADELIEEAVTDANGEAVFIVGEGKYYIVESSVGNWTRFRTMEERIEISCGKDGTVQHFKIEDIPTETRVEKRSASTGELLGNCGVSVRDAGGNLLYFRWNEYLGGYQACEAGRADAVTVLYTNNDPNSNEYGAIRIFGLDSGEYEILEVEAPEGYRNDSEVMRLTVTNTGVLGATRLYDTVKTSETDTMIGVASCSVCGLSALSLFALAAVSIKRRFS